MYRKSRDRKVEVEGLEVKGLEVARDGGNRNEGK